MWEGMDQRRFPRAKCRCVVRLSQGGASSNISSVTENIGLGGVCALLERGLDIFSPVGVELYLEEGKVPIRAQGTVVWVVRRRGRGPSFDTGIEFAQMQPEDKARLEAAIEKLSPK